MNAANFLKKMAFDIIMMWELLVSRQIPSRLIRGVKRIVAALK